jgi:hypothetical protein
MRFARIASSGLPHLDLRLYVTEPELGRLRQFGCRKSLRPDRDLPAKRLGCLLHILALAWQGHMQHICKPQGDYIKHEEHVNCSQYRSIWWALMEKVINILVTQRGFLDQVAHY